MSALAAYQNEGDSTPASASSRPSPSARTAHSIDSAAVPTGGVGLQGDGRQRHTLAERSSSEAGCA